jgi:hypothetical protein
MGEKLVFLGGGLGGIVAGNDLDIYTSRETGATVFLAFV